MADLKEVCKKSFVEMDERNVFWCNPFSRMHCNVWLVTGMALVTASYDLFCIFLVTRLIGRRYFTDDPFVVQRIVLPGRMTLGKEGLLLGICMFGAFFGNLFWGPMADAFGRKLILEIALVIMFVFSVLSAFSFSKVQSLSNADITLGSLCFWRAVLGFGVGAVFPCCATLMSEYSSKFSRGGYLALVFSCQAYGLLLACGVAALAGYGISYNYGGADFPLNVPGCFSFTALGPVAVADGGPVCPLSNQLAYFNQVNASNIQESEYIWRAVVSAGAAPALLTFLLSRYFLYESPRYTAHVLSDHQKAITDLIDQGQDQLAEAALASIFSETEIAAGVIKTPEYTDLSFCGFVFHYSWHLLAASVVYGCVNFVFNGMILQMNEANKILGYNATQPYQNTVDDNRGLVVGFVVLILVGLVPGYFVSVLTIDCIGRRILQIFGLIMISGILAATAATKAMLTNPKNSNDMTVASGYRLRQTGWFVLFGAAFFFMSWGPLTTIFAIPAELFPTRWRASGYGFCNAVGNVIGCVGIFVFLYAQQPPSGAKTYNFPCQGKSLDIAGGMCMELSDCPNGRTYAPGSAVLSSCTYCLPDSLSGCAGFGIGMSGAMAIMIPVLLIGALFTQLLPITTFQSLEDINYMNESIEMFKVEKEKKLKSSEIEIAKKIAEL